MNHHIIFSYSYYPFSYISFIIYIQEFNDKGKDDDKECKDISIIHISFYSVIHDHPHVIKLSPLLFILIIDL